MRIHPHGQLKKRKIVTRSLFMLWLLYFNIFFIYALAPVAKIFNLVPFLIGRVSRLLGQEIPVVQEAPSCSLLPNNIGRE
jgi:hypothetical protein